MSHTDIYTTGSANANWDDAYVASPRFYIRPDGVTFGVFALNEGVDTILPKAPQNRFQSDGQTVSEWRLLLYSRTKGDVIGDTDFFTAMRRLGIGGYVIDDNDTDALVRRLTLTELDALMR
ncbi:MAG: hypothetical protein IKQ39_03695 [Oscillospiraceae bacterium]|nr:hypothetical protein [Oscillospiraceae bacterium]